MTILLWTLAVILGLITVLTWWIGRTTYARISWDVRLDTASALDEAMVKGPPVTLRLVGDLPREMYVGKAENITLQGSATLRPDVALDHPQGIDVEMELLAVAFEVAGGRQQQEHIPQTGGNVSFRWNIMPKKSDTHELAFVTSWIDESGRHEVDAKPHSVKVAQFRGLTARQLSLLRGIAAVGGLILAAAGTCASIAGASVAWLNWLYPR